MSRRGIIHGDVYRGVGGLELSYQPVVGKMRDQVRIYGRYGLATHVSGLKAKMILEKYLCYRSMELVNYLLDENPDHVVEFTVFERSGLNTHIWEVRNDTHYNK